MIEDTIAKQVDISSERLNLRPLRKSDEGLLTFAVPRKVSPLCASVAAWALPCASSATDLRRAGQSCTDPPQRRPL